MSKTTRQKLTHNKGLNLALSKTIRNTTLIRLKFTCEAGHSKLVTDNKVHAEK